MSKQPGSDDDRMIWHRREIRVDLRSPAEVEAEDGFEIPQHHAVTPERRAQMEKTNPYIRHLREWEGVIVPTEEAEGHRGRWQELFDAPRPLVVELGCGAGHFLRDLSAARPDQNYLGIELRYKRLVAAAKKTAERHPNVRYARAHAMSLEALFAPGEVSEVWVQFPDPWPKSRQASKRMVNPELARALARILPPGGRVRLKSDWPLYLPWFRGSFEGTPFEETAFVADLSQWDLPWPNVMTSFEARFMREGKPCFFLEYTLPAAEGA